MSVWSTVSQVVSRVTYGALGTSTTPNTTTVQGWLDEAEAETRGVLRANGIGTDLGAATLGYSAGSDGAIILAKHVVDYVEGRVRAAWASSDGSGENEDGQRELEGYNARLKDMEDRPTVWAARLSVVGEAPAGVRQASSLVTTEPASVPDPIYRVSDIDGAL